MSIKKYELNGKAFWKVYVNVRSKDDPNVRYQKLLPRVKSELEAIKLEKKLLNELGQKVAEEVGLGLKWEFVIDHWEMAAKSGVLGTYNPATIADHVSCLRRLTKPWLKKSAAKISRADARYLFRTLKKEGRSNSGLKKVKNTINVVFKYGLEESLIKGVEQSPVYGIKTGKSSEKSPDILTSDEVKIFLGAAKRYGHEWYAVWAFACLTGMRNGELYALRWSHLEVDWETKDCSKDFIRVSESYNKRTDEFKTTKSGYWRTIPISEELKGLILALKNKSSDSEFVLPRIKSWDRGIQAKVLRGFLKSIGLKSVKFHALRACFTTALLSKGVPSAVIMKICGWRDLKTMAYYVRLAGVDERGATDCLKLLPTREEVTENVVSLFD